MVANLPWRNTRAFLTRAKENRNRKAQLTAEVEDPSVDFESALKDKRKFNEIQVDDFSVSDEEGDGPTLGGKSLTILDANAGSEFSINLHSIPRNTSIVSLVATNENGEVVLEKKLAVQFSGQGEGTVSMQIPSTTPLSGSVQVSAIRNVNARGEENVFDVEGSFIYAENSDFLNNGLNVSIANIGFEIPANSLERIGDAIYLKSGFHIPYLNDLKIWDDGRFLVRAKNMDLSDIYVGGSVPIRASSGNQLLAGEITASALKGHALISEVFDKRVYNAGDRAKLKVYTSTPRPANIGFYLRVKVDGEEIVGQKEAENRWSFVSPRLDAGSHEVSMQLFSQDPVLEAKIKLASDAYRRKVFDLENEIANETDAVEKARLEGERLKLVGHLNDLEATLTRSRRSLADPKVVTIKYE